MKNTFGLPFIYVLYCKLSTFPSCVKKKEYYAYDIFFQNSEKVLGLGELFEYPVNGE